MSLGSRRFDVHLDPFGEMSQRICDWVETIKQKNILAPAKSDVGFITCVLRDLLLGGICRMLQKKNHQHR